MNDPAPVELPINGELDLHMFRPADVKDLVPNYLGNAASAGFCRSASSSRVPLTVWPIRACDGHNIGRSTQSTDLKCDISISTQEAYV